jgi:hypothetical protein
MQRGFVVWLAAIGLSSCDAPTHEALNRRDALGAIEQACLRKAALNFSDFQASTAQNVAEMCGCVRDRVGEQFSDGELDVIATLERTQVEMGMTSSDDFQALEQLRRRYNDALEGLADQTRSRVVADASRDAVTSCRTAQAASAPSNP